MALWGSGRLRTFLAKNSCKISLFVGLKTTPGGSEEEEEEEDDGDDSVIILFSVFSLICLQRKKIKQWIERGSLVSVQEQLYMYVYNSDEERLAFALKKYNPIYFSSSTFLSLSHNSSSYNLVYIYKPLGVNPNPFLCWIQFHLLFLIPQLLIIPIKS